MFLATCTVCQPCIQDHVLLLMTRSIKSSPARAPAEKHPCFGTHSRQPLAPSKDPPDNFNELKPLNDDVFGHEHCLLSLGLYQSPYFIFALFALLTSLLVKYSHSHPPYSLCNLCSLTAFIRSAQHHYAHPLLTFFFPLTNSRIPPQTRSK